MTVRELVQWLATLPQDAVVCGVNVGMTVPSQCEVEDLVLESHTTLGQTSDGPVLVFRPRLGDWGNHDAV